MKEKKVQVTESFLTTALCLAWQIKHMLREPEHFTLCEEDDGRMADKILNEADAIIEARARREKFSEYKTADKSSADREKLRKEYLNMAGIHKKWQTKVES